MASTMWKQRATSASILTTKWKLATFENGKYCEEVRVILGPTVQEREHEWGDRSHKGVLLESWKTWFWQTVMKCCEIKAHHLPQLHVASEMLSWTNYKDTDAKGNCLHGGATSKYHRHCKNFKIPLKDGRSLSLGLKELAWSDSVSEMKAFTELNDHLAVALVDKDT